MDNGSAMAELIIDTDRVGAPVVGQFADGY
jgi:hypothetical protein